MKRNVSSAAALGILTSVQVWWHDVKELCPSAAEAVDNSASATRNGTMTDGRVSTGATRVQRIDAPQSGERV